MTALADKWMVPGPETSPTPSVAALLNGGKPRVELPCSGRLLSEFATEIGMIMRSRGCYNRGGVACLVNDAGAKIEILTAQMVRTFVEDHLVCYRQHRTARGEQIELARTMSVQDAAGVLASGQFLACLPEIEGIATARLPVLHRDGVISLAQVGYDPHARIWTTSDAVSYHTDMPLEEARQVINHLVAEFPFADPGRSKAVAVASMLTLYGMHLLPTGALRPCFIYTANREGAGKTLCAQCATAAVLGVTETKPPPTDNAECKKLLLAAVMEGCPVLLFDNWKGHVNLSALESFVTAANYGDRILGVNKTFTAENRVTVMITGNACTVSPDLRRRALFVELFMEDERAEDRVFREPLDEYALLAQRPQILAALWAMVRDWDANGKPKSSRSHSSAPRWADVIGGIVEQAGFACPLEPAEIVGAADTDHADMRTLVEAMGSDKFNFNELVETMRERDLFDRIVGVSDLDAKARATLGKLLSRYDRTRFNGASQFLIEGKGHGKRFRVQTTLL